MALVGGWAFPVVVLADPAPGEPAILRRADQIFTEVSRLRGLPIKHPVQKKIENRDFFRDYYSRILREQYPPGKQHATEKAYALFGFLPEKADLLQTYLDSFLQVVRGIYDPRTKTLYIADWIDPEEAEGTLAHELDHALQDQYFNLQSYLDKGKDASMDTQFARSSIMEGEATAIALNYELEDKGEDFTQLADIAQWARLANLFEESGDKAFGKTVALHDVVSFPYVYGSAFLQKYVKAYGWSGMDYLFHHPPTSTHQIMHPGIFFPRRQRTFRVAIEDLSPRVLSGYRKIWEDCFGEYGLFLLLRQFLPAAEAQASVKGWQADRIQVYEGTRSERTILAAYVMFDAADSAEDFFKSYRSLLDDKYDVGLFRRSDDTIHWISIAGTDREAYVERFGRRVVFIEGTDEDQTPAVRAALWDFVQAKSLKTTSP